MFCKEATCFGSEFRGLARCLEYPYADLNDGTSPYECRRADEGHFAGYAPVSPCHPAGRAGQRMCGVA